MAGNQIFVILDALVEKMKFLPNLVVEKGRQLWPAMENFRPQILEVLKVKKTNLFTNAMAEKAKELWMMLVEADPWDHFVAWLVRVFPPEKRPELIHLLPQFAKPILLVPAAAFLCYRCGLLQGIFMFIKSFLMGMFRVIGSCCSGGGRMMKAPGKPGVMMPRSVFEANPGAYFRALHANPTGFKLG